MGLFETALTTAVLDTIKPTIGTIQGQATLVEARVALLEAKPDAAPTDIEVLVTDAVETEVENGLESAIEGYFDYNFDMGSHIEDWMQYNFDADELVNDALSSNSDFTGLESRVEDLESLTDQLDMLSERVDAFSSESERMDALESQLEAALAYIRGI